VPCTIEDAMLKLVEEKDFASVEGLHEVRPIYEATELANYFSSICTIINHIDFAPVCFDTG
jgi:hypothetical protein